MAVKYFYSQRIAPVTIPHSANAAMSACEHKTHGEGGWSHPLSSSGEGDIAEVFTVKS